METLMQLILWKVEVPGALVLVAVIGAGIALFGALCAAVVWSIDRILIYLRALDRVAEYTWYRNAFRSWLDDERQYRGNNICALKRPKEADVSTPKNVDGGRRA